MKQIQKNNIAKEEYQDTLEYDYLLKYIISGDAGTGKYQILSRFVNNDFIDSSNTIGVEFGAKNIKIRDKFYRIQIWDTPGQERYKSVTRAYYKGAVCVIIIYSITNRDTFTHIPNWIEECKLLSPKTVTMVLVGNNSHEEDNRQITFDEGNLLAEKYGLQFFEVSALTGQNIDVLFYRITDEISKKIDDGFYAQSFGRRGIITSISEEICEEIELPFEEKFKGEESLKGKCGCSII